MNKCTELNYPFDGRRNAIIITNNKKICEALAKNFDAKIKIEVEK